VVTGAWLRARRYGRVVTGAWLRTRRYGRVVTGASLRARRYGRVVTGAWLRARGYGRVVTGAWLRARRYGLSCCVSTLPPVLHLVQRGRGWSRPRLFPEEWAVESHAALLLCVCRMSACGDNVRVLLTAAGLYTTASMRCEAFVLILSFLGLCRSCRRGAPGCEEDSVL